MRSAHGKVLTIPLYSIVGGSVARSGLRACKSISKCAGPVPAQGLDEGTAGGLENKILSTDEEKAAALTFSKRGTTWPTAIVQQSVAQMSRRDWRPRPGIRARLSTGFRGLSLDCRL